MNERIRELWSKAAESTAAYPSGQNNSWETQVNFLDKFAELIVRECLSIVENNNPRPPGTTIMYSLDKDEYFDTGWQVAVETKSNQIKEHFGVE
jgi:hypothetical protein